MPNNGGLVVFSTFFKSEFGNKGVNDLSHSQLLVFFFADYIEFLHLWLQRI